MIGQRRVVLMTAKLWEELELTHAVRIDRRLAKREGRRDTRSGKGVDGICWLLGEGLCSMAKRSVLLVPWDTRWTILSAAAIIEQIAIVSGRRWLAGGYNQITILLRRIPMSYGLSIQRKDPHSPVNTRRYISESALNMHLSMPHEYVQIVYLQGLFSRTLRASLKKFLGGLLRAFSRVAMGGIFKDISECIF